MAFDLDVVRAAAEHPVFADAKTVDLAADDLSAAFADEENFDWFMRTDADRHSARRRLFRALMRHSALVDGLIERPATGGAAAVWIPSEHSGLLRQLRDFQFMPTLFNATGKSRLFRLISLIIETSKHRPKAPPHDYLWFLGVHPQLQGAGVGSRLLKSGIKRLDRLGRAAWLETASAQNIALYQSFGFQIVSEFRPAQVGPLNWGMWRDSAIMLPSPPADCLT